MAGTEKLLDAFVEFSVKGMEKIDEAIARIKAKVSDPAVVKDGLSTGFREAGEHMLSHSGPVGSLIGATIGAAAGAGFGATFIPKALDALHRLVMAIPNAIHEGMEYAKLADVLGAQIGRENADALISRTRQQYAGTHVNPESALATIRQLLAEGRSLQEAEGDVHRFAVITAGSTHEVDELARALARARLQGEVTTRLLMALQHASPGVIRELQKMHPGFGVGSEGMGLGGKPGSGGRSGDEKAVVTMKELEAALDRVAEAKEKVWGAEVNTASARWAQFGLSIKEAAESFGQFLYQTLQLDKVLWFLDGIGTAIAVIADDVGGLLSPVFETFGEVVQSVLEFVGATLWDIMAMIHGVYVELQNFLALFMNPFGRVAWYGWAKELKNIESPDYTNKDIEKDLARIKERDIKLNTRTIRLEEGVDQKTAREIEEKIRKGLRDRGLSEEGLGGTSPGGMGGGPSGSHPYEFTSLAGLAEKMQIAASQGDDAGERAARSLDSIDKNVAVIAGKSHDKPAVETVLNKTMAPNLLEVW
jgi:hypothetical protein